MARCWLLSANTAPASIPKSFMLKNTLAALVLAGALGAVAASRGGPAIAPGNQPSVRGLPPTPIPNPSSSAPTMGYQAYLQQQKQQKQLQQQHQQSAAVYQKGETSATALNPWQSSPSSYLLPKQNAQPQYPQQPYPQQQYAQQRYAQQQYVPPQYPQPQNAQPQYPQPQNAQPSYPPHPSPQFKPPSISPAASQPSAYPANKQIYPPTPLSHSLPPLRSLPLPPLPPRTKLSHPPYREQVVSGPTKNQFVGSSSVPDVIMVECEICKKPVPSDELDAHERTHAHAVTSQQKSPPSEVAECAFCGKLIPIHDLDQHEIQEASELRNKLKENNENSENSEKEGERLYAAAIERASQVRAERRKNFPDVLKQFMNRKSELQQLDDPMKIFNIDHAAYGAIKRIRDELEAKKSTAFLVSEHTPLIYRTASWDCGYRNFQMMLSAVYALEILGRPRRSAHDAVLAALKSIPNRNPNPNWINGKREQAWKEGFDPSVDRHYSDLLGPSDIYSILALLGIKSTIRVFGKTYSDKTKISRHSDLWRFAFTYFTKAAEHDPDNARRATPWSSVQVLNRPPLYIQHGRHSRSIIGVEQTLTAGGDRQQYLLIIDPSLHIPLKKDGLGKYKRVLPFVRMSLKMLNKHEYYQVLAVGEEGYTPGVVTAADKDVHNIA